MTIVYLWINNNHNRVAILLVGFNGVSALISHQFWREESQMNAFIKSIAMAGGYLMIFAHDSGAY